MGDVPVLDIPMDEDYRKHREQLLVAERELRDQRERVAELPKLRAWAHHRGWTQLRLLSRHGTTFNQDFGVEDAQGEQLAGISVLTRDPTAGGTTRLFYAGSPYYGHGEYRGIDLLCPVWHVLDLLPGGRGDWIPSDGH